MTTRNPAWQSSRRQLVFVVAAVSALTLLWVGLYLYQAQAQFSVNKSNVSETGVISKGSINHATGTARAATVSGPKKIPLLEIHVANDGIILLRDAKVISVSEDTFHVLMTWNSVEFFWEIQTKFFTKVMTAKGEQMTLANIKVGDIVTITGELIAGGPEPIIAAQFVRD